MTFVFGRFYPINDVGNYSQAYNWDTKANSFVANTVGQIAQPVLDSIQNDKNRELLVFRDKPFGVLPKIYRISANGNLDFLHVIQ